MIIYADLICQNFIYALIIIIKVPASVSNLDFWSRYFFKAKLIEDTNKTRTDLIERATSKVSDSSAYEKVDWDEDGNLYNY